MSAPHPTRAPRLPRAARAVAPPALVVLSLLGAWEIYCDAGGVSRYVLPAPHAVASALWTNASTLASNLATTAAEVGFGILLSFVVGLTLAVAIHFSTALRRTLYPLAVGSQAVPIFAVAPLLVYWWGFGILPKLVVIAVVCFFPVVVTTVDALARVDPDQLKLLRTLDASRWQAFRFAEAPAALPAALSGARIALAVGVIGAVFAETTTGATSGLGLLVEQSIDQLDIALAYAAVVVLAVFAVSCFSLLGVAERALGDGVTRPRRRWPPLIPRRALLEGDLK